MFTNVLRASLVRATGFLAFWLVLFGLNPADLPVAALTAAAATWASLRLLPPGRWRLRPLALVRLALRFLCQSVVAGIDVARRALDPRMPLRPGFVAYPVSFPPGTARNVFATLTSLLPGTVPAGEASGQLVYHCLDVDQPVASQLAAEETALARAIHDD
jgi:multicomponent Na+:H+ antiporter subunit E